MSRNTWWGKLLRIVGIVLMGLMAVFTLLSGAGTSCVALAAEKFGPSMASIAPYKPIYIAFVLVTLAIGAYAVLATIKLVRGRSDAYRSALIALVAGILVGGIHMAVSRLLRGKSQPVDMVVYVTVLTLIVFLLFRIPKVWEGVSFSQPSPSDSHERLGAAITLMVCGFTVITVPFWAASTHTISGVNFADAWHWPLTLLGLALILADSGWCAVRSFHVPVLRVRLDRVGF